MLSNHAVTSISAFTSSIQVSTVWAVVVFSFASLLGDLNGFGRECRTQDIHYNKPCESLE